MDLYDLYERCLGRLNMCSIDTIIILTLEWYPHHSYCPTGIGELLGYSWLGIDLKKNCNWVLFVVCLFVCLVVGPPKVRIKNLLKSFTVKQFQFLQNFAQQCAPFYKRANRCNRRRRAHKVFQLKIWISDSYNALFLTPATQMSLFSMHHVFSLIMKDGVENSYIFRRSVSVAVFSQSLSNRGMFHQRTVRHIQDALWFSFWKKYKTGDSNDIAGSPLPTLIEESILASGVLSVGRSLLEQVTVIFQAPTGVHKQGPLPSLHHMSW